LAADFENRVHIRVEVDRRRGVRDDLVDHPLGQGMQARDLASRPANAQTDDGHSRGVDLAAHLFEYGTVALARGTHRVAVGAQVDGGQQGIVLLADQNRLGGGRAHVQPEQADICLANGIAAHTLEGDLVFELPQGC